MRKMNKIPLIAVAPILSVLLFVLPVHAAPIPGSAQGEGWERRIDTEKPVINASVYDGTLSIEVSDKGSGVKAIFVNGYEFTDIEDGLLEIRLSRFDAAYDFFEISAIDEAGNMSATYRVRNPYYEDPEAEDDDSDSDPSEMLPIEAGPTDPVDSTAVVTDYNETNEFYTITASSGKVFYLIIDKSEDEETVYFLTEISENDLLNVTSDTNETLPRNTAVEDSAIPVESIPAETAHTVTQTTDEEKEDSSVNEDKPDIKEKVEEIKQNPMAGYILMGIVGAVVIAIGYYLKVVKKKQDGDFVEDEDDDDEDEYEDPDEEDDRPEPSEDDATDSIE